MLFQPTNITPNVLAGAENSTVNASTGFYVTWQINGNSPMEAFRIGIYEHPQTTEDYYTSNLQHLTTPVYPVDYKGEPQTYSWYISPEAAAAGGIVNGKDYTIAIRQFWDRNNEDSAHSVRNSSYPVFHARGAAHVSLSPADESTISSYSQTFTASYWQGNEYDLTDDPIEWVRWRIYDSADMGRTIYDSQRIYTQELKLEYDGFLNGRDYKVYLDIQNTVGQAASANALYHVSWQASTTKNVAQVTRLNSQSSAVQVSWGGIDYIPASITNYAMIANGRAVLDNNCAITYNQKNGSAMSLPAPWALAMYTEIFPTSDNPTVNILEVTMSGGSKHTVSYNRSTGYISLTGYSGTAYTASMPYSDEANIFKIVITGTAITVYRYSAGYGLTPSDTLTASAYLTPSYTEGLHALTGAQKNLSGTQTAITEIKMSGSQKIDFIEVISDVTEEQLDVLDNWIHGGSDDAITVMQGYGNASLLAEYTTSLDAGNYSIGGVAIKGWEVYRKRKSEAFARHLCSLELDQMEFLDYGCGSQMGKYTYFIYPRSNSGTYITTALQSNTIKPVFWNWSIVEATYDKDNERYNVVNEYIFRNNVASGGITNNNNPTISDNFTQYPTVQMATANYQSGTLTGLIGQVGYTSYVVQYGNSLVDLEERFGTSQQDILDDNGLATWENHGYTGMVIRLVNPQGGVEYFDDKAQRDAIWNLSTSTNHLFLKSRKGDVIEIKIAGAISMDTADNTPQQAITASIPWVQIDDAQDKTIVCGI